MAYAYTKKQSVKIATDEVVQQVPLLPGKKLARNNWNFVLQHGVAGARYYYLLIREG